VTQRLELMVAVRPTFHTPALFAKQAANIDHISRGRLALNVVSSWWEQEARMYGVDFERHDDRYGRTSEWLDVVDGVWKQKSYSHNGKYYKTESTVLEPKPVRNPRPPIYAGGESEAAKNLIALKCDAYVMHGDSPEHVKAKIIDMCARREKFGLGPMQFGVAGYAFTRDSDAQVKQELARITDVKQNAKGFANYQQWLQGTQLEQKMSIEEYSVSNRGLRSGLVGVPGAVQEQVGRFEEAGVNLLLLQFSPQLEEMERFSQSVIQPLH
jgi:FMNH2-dependent dimethyl sulfone monooxygenase